VAANASTNSFEVEPGTHTVGKSQVSNGKAMGGGKGRRVNVNDA